MNERKEGFTLIELLLVIAIMVVMIVMIVPAFSSLERSSHLTNAAQMFIDQLNRARQESLTSNRLVEVRFYQTASQQDPMPAYRALRYVVLNDTATGPGVSTTAESVQYLPPGVIISTGSAASGSLSTFANLPTSLDQSLSTPNEELLPHSTSAVPFYCFHFRPNGSTDLTSTSTSGVNVNWYWSLRVQYDPPLELQGGAAVTSLPSNYAIIQLDPATGIVRLFRP